MNSHSQSSQDTSAISVGNAPSSHTSPLPPPDQIAAAIASIDILAGWLENTSLSAAAIAQWKYNCLASTFPALGNLVESAKSLIGTTMPVPDTGMGVTVLATLLSESCQNKIKPADVNKALVELGLQVRQEKERVWELTDAGMEHGQSFLATSKTNDWQGVQVKWFKSVIPLLEDYFLSDAPLSETTEPQQVQVEKSASASKTRSSTNSNKATETREFWLVEERAKHNGVKTNANQRLHIEMYATDSYKQRHGKPPTKQQVKNTSSTAYPVADVDLLDAAINTVMALPQGTVTKSGKD